MALGTVNVGRPMDPADYVKSVLLAAANGVATLDANGKLNSSQKPSYSKSEVGLGNVDNTSDTNKPVSTAQATAIADAKQAGTTAQENLDSHTGNKSNPHGVTLAQLGVTASADELNYCDGVTSNIQTQLDTLSSEKAPAGYGLGGEPKGVDYATINSIHQTGWYFTANADASIFGYDYVFFEVIGIDSNSAVQIAYPLYHNSGTKNYRLHRQCTAGAWGEWEWVNPPMIAGVEYRTTERYNGKVVYSMFSGTGLVTSGGNIQFTNESITPIGVNACANGHTLPYFAGGKDLNSQYAIWSEIKNNIFMGYFGSAYSSVTFNFQVWYIKD